MVFAVDVGAVAVAAQKLEGPYAAYGCHNSSFVHSALPELITYHTRRRCFAASVCSYVCARGNSKEMVSL